MAGDHATLFSKTRLMDRSESLFAGLESALEAFLIPYKDLEISKRRYSMQPVLWVMQSNELNFKVYDALLENKCNVLNEILKDVSLRSRI